MDGGAWWAAVHGVTRSQTRLSDFTFTFHFHALEKETATHSSALAWRIPGTGEPGGLPSVGSHRVGHGWRDLAAAGLRKSVKFCVTFGHFVLLCILKAVPIDLGSLVPPKMLITFAMKMYQNTNSGPRMVGLWMIFPPVAYGSLKYSLTKYPLSPKQV